mgnify:CR=1 FL=1
MKTDLNYSAWLYAHVHLQLVMTMKELMDPVTVTNPPCNM